MPYKPKLSRLTDVSGLPEFMNFISQEYHPVSGF